MISGRSSDENRGFFAGFRRKKASDSKASDSKASEAKGPSLRDLIQELDCIPDRFLCPINGDIMRDPVSTSVGNDYDRPFIAKWFQDHDTNPLTNLPLADKSLKPNPALKQEIQKFNKELDMLDNNEAMLSLVKKLQEDAKKQRQEAEIAIAALYKAEERAETKSLLLEQAKKELTESQLEIQKQTKIIVEQNQALTQLREQHNLVLQEAEIAKKKLYAALAKTEYNFLLQKAKMKNEKSRAVSNRNGLSVSKSIPDKKKDLSERENAPLQVKYNHLQIEHSKLQARNDNMSDERAFERVRFRRALAQFQSELPSKQKLVSADREKKLNVKLDQIKQKKQDGRKPIVVIHPQGQKEEEGEVKVEKIYRRKNPQVSAQGFFGDEQKRDKNDARALSLKASDQSDRGSVLDQLPLMPAASLKAVVKSSGVSNSNPSSIAASESSAAPIAAELPPPAVGNQLLRDLISDDESDSVSEEDHPETRERNDSYHAYCSRTRFC
jgi:hypothetical protein